jgi:hypothetical protein
MNLKLVLLPEPELVNVITSLNPFNNILLILLIFLLESKINALLASAVPIVVISL